MDPGEGSNFGGFVNMSVFSAVATRRLGYLAVVLGLLSPVLVATPAAAAEPAATASASSPQTVSADPLPTVQINGVAWTQAVKGNTVYVGGEFTNARPAGAAAGTNLTTRTNLLAYNLTTGVLDPNWDPGTNGKVLSMTLSPDGSRLYIAGTFTTVAGQSRYNIAAFDTATGALTSWRPTTNGTVTSVAATNSTVYLTGNFSTVNSTTRLRIAAVTAANAALVTSFAPTLEGGYGGRGVVISPDGSKIVVAGSFTSTNGSTNPDQGRGMAALDASTGALLPWKVSSVLRNAGDYASMYSLSSDGDSVYGTGYDYGGDRVSLDNFEGAFRADWSDGTMRWMEDCHGDTYSVQPVDGVVYTAAHTHYCGNIGEFPQEDPWYYNHALAFDKEPSSNTITPDPYGYRSFTGNPAAKLLHWYPKWSPGSFTGMNQAGWDVRTSGNYLLYAGEFMTVGGVAQQGLVRFAKRAAAPNAVGPSIKGGNYKVFPASFVTGTVRVAWQANHDPDSAELTYEIFRQGVAQPLYTTTASSTYWVRPTMIYVDSDLTPGQTYNYRVRATDSDGNMQQSNWTPVTVATTGSATNYNSAVLADTPTSYWPLNEASGTVGYDWAFGNDLALGATGITRGVTGPNTAQANLATRFAGTSTAFGATASTRSGPQVFSAEAWFRTTSNAGGKIVGFGNAATGNSTSYDRHIYLSGSGQVTFGVYPGTARTITSSSGYNNGQWHHVVGTLGPNGMTLYLDGKRVGARGDTTSAQGYSGYWRVGGDNLDGWSATGSSRYLNGDIADVAVYDSVLSRDDVNEHWVAAGRTSTFPASPADGYGASVYSLDPLLYWRLSETSGTTAADAGKDASNGTYFGTTRITRGVAGALTSVANTAVSFNPRGMATGVSSNAAFTNPSSYSVEAWFRTSTTEGGKLVGFGGSQTGTSSNYDRHIYMSPAGQLRFGVWTGEAQVIGTSASYNNNAWHHVVGTQSSEGMRFYVDGALVGSNGVSYAQDYTGYWRVGGDSGWEGATWWTGAIDEVAVYGRALTAAQVQEHYSLGKDGKVNQLPSASFVTGSDGLTASFDAAASTDPDGTIQQYAWDFGDGTTGSGQAATHTYAAGGDYSVKLTVTDDAGATATAEQQISVLAPNVPPVATFTLTQGTGSGPGIAVDAGASSDPDGLIAGYAWDFGDGQTATGVQATHTYQRSGTHTVTLTVTDNRGGTATAEQQVSVVIPNSAPVAAFTFTTSGLEVSFDASGSTDADGDDLTYAWDFGDSATGTGKTVSHSYQVTAETTFQVALTVSDGEDSDTVTVPVTLAPAPTQEVLAKDAFGRSATGAWGSADKGGSWSLSGGSAAFSVAGGQGLATLAPGHTRSAALAAVSSDTTVTEVQVGSSVASAGGIANATIVGRLVGSAFYSVRLRFEIGGKVRFQLLRSSGGEAGLGSIYELPGDYTPGELVNVRLAVSGTSPTTIAAKAWHEGSAVPADWQREATDSTAALQAAGSVALRSAVSSASTVPTTVLAYDNYLVTTGAPAAPNTAPVAAFGSAVDGLKATVDASDSTDADGDQLSYSWNFGDGATGTGKTATHTYADAGTYQIKLTVSDGEDSDSVTHSVTVSAPAQAVVAKDDFGRTVAAGSWGSADDGGTWTLSGGSAEFSVADGVGKVTVPVGGTREARLTQVSGTAMLVEARVAVDAVPTAGATSATVIARRVGSSYYGARLRFEPAGVVRLYLLRDETSLGSVVLSGTYTADAAIKMKLSVTGTSPTRLAAKAWYADDAEPADWLREATDSTAAMQDAGYLALRSSVGASSAAAARLSYDGYRATRLE